MRQDLSLCAQINLIKRYSVGTLLLLIIAIPQTAIAKPSIDNRISELERLTQGQGQLLQELQNQMMDVQRDIDGLRGQLQLNQYQLEQTIDRQKQIYQQIDELSKTSTEQKAPTPDVKSEGLVFSNDDKKDYNVIITLMLEKKEYDQAIIGFQEFIKYYPKSRYLANANYWLGQMFYNKNKKDEAAYYYAVVVKDFPKDQKAADSMYKVGVIFQDKGDKQQAKAIYQQVVKQYSNTQTAVQAQRRLNAL